MIVRRLGLVTPALAVAAIALVPADQPAGLRLSAGRGALRLANSRDGSAVLNVRNMKPGETATGSVALTNKGNRPARLFLRSSAPHGALADALRVAVTGVGTGDLRSLAGCHDLGVLRTGETRTYRFAAEWPPTAADNAYSGAGVSVDERWVVNDHGSPCLPAARSAPTLAISHRHVALVRGRAKLYVRCIAASACSGAITLRPRTGLTSRVATTAGARRARFAIAAGRRRALYLRVPAASRAALRLRRKAIVLAELDPAGPAERVTRLLTLVRSRSPSAGR